MDFYINSKFEVNHYRFYSDKVSRDVRLAVLADLHNCMCEDGGRQLFHVIEGEEPDVIVLAGDMVNSVSGTDMKPVMEFIRLLNEHYPVVYGMGNHERKVLEGPCLFAERRAFAEGLKHSGVRLLSNAHKNLWDSGIRISCLDLPLKYFRRHDHLPLEVSDLYEMLGEPDRRYFNVLIAHDPQYFMTYSEYGPEVILSGHMHGGVIRFPFLGGFISPKLRLFPRYTSGSFERKGSRMIVSKGLGMHTIKVRVNNPTELVIADITGAKNNGKQS